jgi:hypothetical protein
MLRFLGLRACRAGETIASELKVTMVIPWAVRGEMADFPTESFSSIKTAGKPDPLTAVFHIAR